jgi:hypothetical protein
VYWNSTHGFTPLAPAHIHSMPRHTANSARHNEENPPYFFVCRFWNHFLLVAFPSVLRALADAFFLSYLSGTIFFTSMQRPIGDCIGGRFTMARQICVPMDHRGTRLSFNRSGRHWQ